MVDNYEISVLIGTVLSFEKKKFVFSFRGPKKKKFLPESDDFKWKGH